MDTRQREIDKLQAILARLEWRANVLPEKLTQHLKVHPHHVSNARKILSDRLFELQNQIAKEK